VKIHDSEFNEIEDIILNVKEIVLIDSNDLETKIKPINPIFSIFNITDNNPVLLSDVSIKPGEYSQIRLILGNLNKIKINNNEIDIKIPSGEQSGLKFNGPFLIQNGMLFEFVFDFNIENQ